MTQLSHSVRLSDVSEPAAYNCIYLLLDGSPTTEQNLAASPEFQALVAKVSCGMTCLALRLQPCDSRSVPPALACIKQGSGAALLS
jgi:hypothetical protein